ncbi:MAG: ABC transporter [Zestosphaera tikiterensis]|uniref:ABC transporter n=1 Tax=Zestosphaera tikiterensis TaxID=1973259 RepID=A0A2R7Y8P6_9CREN|nr:MAG: ABC transporter [Zestosphaera tikiterensis]
MIKLVNVWFKYVGGREWVLKDVNLEFRRGEVVVLRGPNASGKTTLMKVASLIYKPSKGSVVVNDDMDVWSRGGDYLVKYRRMVTYVSEKPVMFKGTVYDNIAYGLTLRNYSLSEVERRVYEVSRKLGIEHMLDKDVKVLSAGEKQVVSLARALVLTPAIMFLDEPLTNVDEDRRKTVINALKEFKSLGSGLVIATHLYEGLDEINPDKVVILKNGVVVKIT